MSKPNSFRWSMESEPHKPRTKEIIYKHPEIRTLIGRNPWTFAVILLCVGFQLVLSYFLRDAAWWVIFLVAYFGGAFASHTLYVCIHEAAHNLLFKKSFYNKVSAIVANLPLVFPSAISFQKYHLKHHSYQGVEELDADMPYRWEAKLINNSGFGKAIWLLFYPVFQMIRPGRIKEVTLMDKWTVVNIIVQLAFMTVFIYFLGWKAAAYMTMSFFFSVGLHPLGARWVQEHFLTHGDQETKSYYGSMNTVNLNVGYHNEHHDFPSIPWNKLPQIKKTAPAFYDSLASHRSWTKLFFRFLFDREISLFSRVVRKERGKVALTDESKPDLEATSKPDPEATAHSPALTAQN